MIVTERDDIDGDYHCLNVIRGMSIAINVFNTYYKYISDLSYMQLDGKSYINYIDEDLQYYIQKCIFSDKSLEELDNLDNSDYKSIEGPGILSDRLLDEFMRASKLINEIAKLEVDFSDFNDLYADTEFDVDHNEKIDCSNDYSNFVYTFYPIESRIPIYASICIKDYMFSDEGEEAKLRIFSIFKCSYAPISKELISEYSDMLYDFELKDCKDIYGQIKRISMLMRVYEERICLQIDDLADKYSQQPLFKAAN